MLHAFRNFASHTFAADSADDDDDGGGEDNDEDDDGENDDEEDDAGGDAVGVAIVDLYTEPASNSWLFMR